VQLQTGGLGEIKNFRRPAMDKFGPQLYRRITGAGWMGKYASANTVACLEHGDATPRRGERLGGC
jgi:hypothetical protein